MRRVSPGRVLADQAQDQGPDRAYGRWPATPFPFRNVHLPLLREVAVPAQDRVRPDEQLQPSQDRPGQGLQQCGEERPVRRCEGHRALAELALQHGESMAQGEDLHVLGTVTHRQQTQDGEGVSHGQIGQTKQHQTIRTASNARSGWPTGATGATLAQNR